MMKIITLMNALVVAACMQIPIAHAIAVNGQGSWETSLLARDLDGDLSSVEAYYDTALNITWLENASYSGGRLKWDVASSLAADFNPYGSGIVGWRLPNIVDIGEPGCVFTFSGGECGFNVDTLTGELAHMFYVTLGNKAYYRDDATSPQSGWGLTNTGPFSNLLSDIYWTGTLYALSDDDAYTFDFTFGTQSYKRYTGAFDDYSVWLVHDGDVGASIVPLPASMWLFVSGLLGLVGLASRSVKLPCRRACLDEATSAI